MSCCLTAFLGYCTLVNDFAPQAHCNDVLNDFHCKSSNGVKNAFLQLCVLSRYWYWYWCAWGIIFSKLL